MTLALIMQKRYKIMMPSNDTFGQSCGVDANLAESDSNSLKIDYDSGSTPTPTTVLQDTM